MKVNVNNKVFTVILLLSFCFISSLYGGSFNYNRMNLSSNISSKILPLENIDGNLNSSQIRSIMGSFFTAGTNYGYFTIKLSSERIGYGPNNDAIFAVYMTTSILLLCIPMGILPCGEDRYKLVATIEFYDNNKRKIADYSDSKIYDGLDYLYSNDHSLNDHTYKTERYFRDLIRNCQNAASKNADNINKLLIEAKDQQYPIETVTKNAFNELKNKIPECTTSTCNAIGIISSRQNTDVIVGTRQIESQFINGGYHVVERSSIDLIMAELALSNSVLVSNEDALRIGRIVSAKYLLIVDIAGEGGNQKLNFRAIKVETGKVIASYNSGFKN